jgi:hypothetical protein
MDRIGSTEACSWARGRGSMGRTGFMGTLIIAMIRTMGTRDQCPIAGRVPSTTFMLMRLAMDRDMWATRAMKAAENAAEASRAAGMPAVAEGVGAKAQDGKSKGKSEC